MNACDSAGSIYRRKKRGGFAFNDLRHMTKTDARNSSVDRSIRMVMFKHSGGTVYGYSYNTIDHQDLLTSVDQIELFLTYVDRKTKKEPAEAG